MGQSKSIPIKTLEFPYTYNIETEEIITITYPISFIGYTKYDLKLYEEKISFINELSNQGKLNHKIMKSINNTHTFENFNNLQKNILRM